MSNSAEVSNPASSTSHHSAQVLPTRRIRVIGVPLDLGASRRGVDMGPRRCAWPGCRRGWKRWAMR